MKIRNLKSEIRKIGCVVVAPIWILRSFQAPHLPSQCYFFEFRFIPISHAHTT